MPLGYEADGRTLKIIPNEADTVRLIFQLYKELGSIHAVCHELNARGVTSKRSVSKAGNVRGGLPMERGALFHLLSNRVYLGQVPHKGAWHPGQHPPILDNAIFEEAQQRLLTQAGAQRRRRAGLEPLVPAAPLTGLVFTKAGDKKSPVTASTLPHGDGAEATPITSPKPDPALLKALTKAQAWKQQLLDGRAATLEAIGAQEGLQGSHIPRLIRLAFLAPDLKAAILSGRMPPAMTLQRLMQYGVADLWSQQRRDMAR